VSFGRHGSRLRNEAFFRGSLHTAGRTILEASRAVRIQDKMLLLQELRHKAALPLKADLLPQVDE